MSSPTEQDTGAEDIRAGRVYTLPTFEEREIEVQALVRLTWPSTVMPQILAASDLQIHDTETGADIGTSTLMLRMVAAGDAQHGAQGPVLLCLLQLVTEDGTPLGPDDQPVKFNAARHEALRGGELRIGVVQDFLVRELWYIVAEMEVGPPRVDPEPSPEDEIPDALLAEEYDPENQADDEIAAGHTTFYASDEEFQAALNEED